MIRILADPDPDPDADPDPQHCTYPHQSDKLDPEPDTDPHQYANWKPKFIEYEPIWALFQGFEPLFGSDADPQHWLSKSRQNSSA